MEIYGLMERFLDQKFEAAKEEAVYMEKETDLSIARLIKEQWEREAVPVYPAAGIRAEASVGRADYHSIHPEFL